MEQQRRQQLRTDLVQRLFAEVSGMCSGDDPMPANDGVSSLGYTAGIALAIIAAVPGGRPGEMTRVVEEFLLAANQAYQEKAREPLFEHLGPGIFGVAVEAVGTKQ